VYEGPLPPVTGVSYASPPPPPFYWFFWEFTSNLPSNQTRKATLWNSSSGFLFSWQFSSLIKRKLRKGLCSFPLLIESLVSQWDFIASLLLIIEAEKRIKRGKRRRSLHIYLNL
jgi:hypothetical protein